MILNGFKFLYCVGFIFDRFQLGSTLKDGERWKNVKIIIESIVRGSLPIKIDDFILNLRDTFDSYENGIFQVKNLSMTTANQQIGFWKFHDYRALQIKVRGKELTLDFETLNNPQLCLSILYHSGGSHWEFPVAATLTITSNTEIISTDHLQAGGNWQEYRRVFHLSINTKYQLSLMPLEFYSRFVIGEIRVCHEREYSVTKMKINPDEKNIKCSILNEDNKYIAQKLDDNGFSYVCPEGSFGENCDIQCLKFGSDNCKDLLVCSTKVCSCLPGYSGTYCEIECQGTYGPRCRIPCNHCRNRTQCDFVNGVCPNADCEDGYMPGRGTLCEHRCWDGTFGHNCKQNCSPFCPVPNRCSHIDGSCTQHKCSNENYEPPTCQYPRIITRVAPQLTKSKVDSLKLSIPSQGFPDEICHLVHQIGAQYRLHDQSTATEWHEGEKLPFSNTTSEIELSSLTPKTTYDVRVILYDAKSNGNVGDKVPVLSGVTTLCRPAGRQEMQVEPEGKIIKVKINIQENKEECDQSTDYVISIRGTGKYVILNEELMGHSAELEYDTLYTVEIKASDMIETFDVSTEQGLSTMKIIIGVLVFLIFVLIIAFLFTFWCYYRHKMRRIGTTPTAAVLDEVVYDEIDIRKAVLDPELPPRPMVREIPGHPSVTEPNHYDVIHEPQPSKEKKKRFSRRTVDQDGYEVPVCRRNVAESAL